MPPTKRRGSGSQSGQRTASSAAAARKPPRRVATRSLFRNRYILWMLVAVVVMGVAWMGWFQSASDAEAGGDGGSPVDRVMRAPRLSSSFPSPSSPPRRAIEKAKATGREATPGNALTAEEAAAQHLQEKKEMHPASDVARQRVVAVVGGGLAGQSAAITAAQHGAEVFLLDKESRLGGNSAKATSGINGWGTHAQAAQGVADGPKLFERDTFASGRGGNCRPGLVRMLSVKSAEAIDWLSQFGIPLTVLSQLGGHSRKRTHRAPDKPDGTPMPIGFTMVSALEKHIRANLSDRVHIVPDATMLRLLHETVQQPNGDAVRRVTGVEYRKRYPLPKDAPPEATEKPAETIALAADAVILATGGFSNDHTDASLLDEHAPNLSGFPTTNGPWATGDGVKAARALGAELVDMDKVQLHPTGLLNPKNPDAKTVFLGPEALRGSGGILVNKKGERFVNELELRSVVSQAIIAQQDEYPNSGGRRFAFCILNEAAADAFGRPTLGFYGKKMGLFTEAEDVAALAQLIGCPEDTIRQTLTDYEKVSAANATCPQTGKTVYPCVLGPQGPFYVAFVTPSIHYTMGGCLISPSAEIQSTTRTLFGRRRRPILGLFGAGEVTGGVHGKNRLGGNSLLECAVFGRIAGERAARAVSHPAETFPGGVPTGTWVRGVVEEFLPEDGDEGDPTTRGGQLLLSLPSAFQSSGLSLGQTLGLRGTHDGQERVVYLHPSTVPSTLGGVGVYLPAPSSPLATPADSWLHALQPGDTVELAAGPAAPGLTERLMSGEDGRLVIFATAPHGVGAALQILQAAREEPLRSKLSHVQLIYAARNASALSYRDILATCSADGADKGFIDCHFILEDPPGKWADGVGVINASTAFRVLPEPGSAESARTTVVQAGSHASTRPVHIALVANGFVDGENLFSFIG